MSGAPVAGSFGYFGKVPARGDFINDQLPTAFVECWNEWLQAVMAVSREQLGDNWLDYYLTSPIWHFALSPGVCGDTAVAGTLMPSVDQVGRHFFFTLASESGAAPAALWQEREWSQQAEDHVLKVLEDDIDLKQWAEHLQQQKWLDGLAPTVPNVEIASGASSQLALHGEEDLQPVHMLHQAYRQQYDRYCIWWTAGSERIPPSTLITGGLPLVSQFAAMLDGNWSQWGW